MLRHPKTFGELRESQDSFGRAKRGKRLLPTAWDDIFMNRSDRNWKKFRKTRWKTA